MNLKKRYCVPAHIVLMMIAVLCSKAFGQQTPINLQAVTDGSGNPVVFGEAYISWKPFWDDAGHYVPAGQETAHIRNGLLTTTLVASDNAGYVYNVVVMSGGTASNFKWKIPAGSTVTQASQLAAQQNLPGQPVCNPGLRGQTFVVPNTSSGDQLQVCLDISGTYAWMAINVSTSLPGITPVSPTAPSGPSYNLVNASVANEVRYNDQFAGTNGAMKTGNYTQGDTWFYTWADDGNLYTTFNDGKGGNTAASKAGNIGVAKVSADLNTITNINQMTDYGTSAQTNTNGWTDGATWKTRGLSSIHGALYLTVVRQLDNAPWTITSASILKSTDHGQTWCNSTHSSGTGCSTTPGQTGDAPLGGQAMWTGAALPMASPTAVTYCQDSSAGCPNIDNNGTYTYWTSNSGNYSGVTLARVRTSANMQDVTQWQYFTGGNGGDITQDANWSSSMSNAVPLITGPFSTWVPAYYIQQLGMYVMLVEENNGNTGNTVIYTSAHVGGPWNKSAFVNGDEQALGYPSLVMSKVQPLSSTPPSVSVTLASSGSYVTQTQGLTYPLTDSYSVHYQTLTLSGASTSPLQASVAAYVDSNSKTGELADLAMLPEASATGQITDYSGQGNNAKSNGAAVYTSQGLASFNGAGYNVTANTYAGQDFTLYIVFRQMMQHSAGEVIFSDNSISLYRNGTSNDSFYFYALGKQTTVTLQDGVWNMVVVRRSGSTINLYDSASFSSATPTPIATIAGVSGNIGMYPLTLGSNYQDPSAPGTNWFNGVIAKYSFYTSALDDVTMSQNENAFTEEMATRKIYLPRAIASTEQPLDFQPPMAAWSVRKLMSRYSGPALNVRRSSDNATEDIGFTASGNLDTAGLLRFCGSSNCYVAKAYDQSGNGFDFVQGVASAQPVIVNAGTLATSGTTGKPALQFNGSQSLATIPGFFYYGFESSVNAVANLSSSAAAWGHVVELANPVDPSQLNASSSVAILQNNQYPAFTYDRNNLIATAGASASSNMTFGTPSSVWSVYDSWLQRMQVDGTVLQAQPLGFTPPYYQRFEVNSIVTGNSLSGGSGITGQVSEVAMFPYAVGAEAISAIRAGQVSYFGAGVVGSGNGSNGSPTPTVSYLLSGLPAPAAAYSLRQLSGTYTGKAINVVRSSDKTVQDIGFTLSGDLDTASLSTFCGSNTCSVDVWYDQSGNGKNLTQTTAATQPVIVNAGVLVTKNGKTAAMFNGPMGLQGAVSFTSSQLEAMLVGTMAANADPYTLMLELTDANNDASNSTQGLVMPFIRDGSNGLTFYRDGYAVNGGNGIAFTGGNLFWMDAQFSGTTNGALVIDEGSPQATNGVTNENFKSTGITLGPQPTSPASSVASAEYVSELVLWPQTLTTAQQSSAHSSQKTYFGLP